MKPFSLQSPEAVAKEYGGNKQQIAQAMQMGLVDPTSGVMAGMFIDRMRSAQSLEQAPKQTVAQEVFQPPQPMPQQQPQMQGAPMQPQGGVAGLSVPRGALNFAGGGLVAFSGGGTSAMGAMRNRADSMLNIEELRKKILEHYGVSAGLGGVRDETSVRVRNMSHGELQKLAASLGIYGGVESMQGRSATPPIAEMPLSDDASVRDEELNFNPLTAQQPAGGLGAITPTGFGELSQEAQIKVPTREIDDVAGLAAYMKEYQGLMPGRGEQTQAYDDYLAGQGERSKKQGKEDFWTAVAQTGLGMAGTQSPYFMQAVGQAGTAAMPTLVESMKNRRAQEASTMKERAGLEQIERGDTLKALEMGSGSREAALGRKGSAEEGEANRQMQAILAQMDEGRRTEMEGYAKLYAEDRIRSGDTRAYGSIVLEGMNELMSQKRYVGMQGLDLRGGQQDIDTSMKVMEMTNELLSDRMSVESKEYNRIKREKGAEAAQQYFDTVYQRLYGRVTGGGGAAPQGRVIDFSELP